MRLSTRLQMSAPGPMTTMLVVAGALIKPGPEARVLLAQRPEGKRLAGLWEFPGGKVEEGETLTVETPVTLRWDNGTGLIFRRTISVDEDYMFTITQSVENTNEDAARLECESATLTIG